MLKLNNKEYKSLCKVIDYLYQPEYEHYEQTINNVINDVDIIDVDNHIFNDVKRLANATNRIKGS